MRRWVLCCAVLFMGAAAMGVQPPGTQERAPLVFRVTGEAQAFPQMAVLRFTIVGEAETLEKAQEQLQKIEADVLKALEKFKIPRGQMQTERFAVIPLQPSVSTPPSLALRPLGYRVQRGYSLTLPVTVEKLGELLAIADAVLKHGARPTVLGGEERGYYSERPAYTLLEFMLTDPDKLLQQAMDDALQRARKLAEQAVQQIGKVSVWLVRVQVSQIQTHPERRFVTPEGRDPVHTFVWQPIRVTIQLEAAFTYE